MAMAAQENFPHDLVEEILVRLSAKSLIRFKSVSNQWNLLVTDPVFIKSHKAKASATNNHMNFFVCDYEVESVCALRIVNDCFDFDNEDGIVRVEEPKSPLKPNEEVYVGVAHCNGLLCVLTRERKVVVWNPSTNEHRRFDLPWILSNHRSNPQSLGLGYDSTNDDYKVVVLIVYNYVLSLKAGSWKHVPYKGYSFRSKEIATPFNGCLNWSSEYSIVCFDLERDVMKEEKGSFCGTLGILGEHLCSTVNGYFISNGHLRGCTHVWIRKDEGWSKLFSIPVTNLGVTWRRGLKIICSVGNDKILISKISHEDLLLYDIKYNTFKKIAIKGHTDEYMRWRTIVPYDVSLVRPMEEILRV